ATIPLEYFYIKRTGPSLLRTLLSKVTWGVSTGYGHTVFSHDLSGYGIAQNPGASPVIFNGTQVAAGYSNWFNRVVTTPNTVTGQTFLVNSDTASIGFRSRAGSIPLRLTLYFEFDRYRIGGGYSVEYMKIGDFKPISHGEDINAFSPEDPSIILRSEEHTSELQSRENLVCRPP